MLRKFFNKNPQCHIKQLLKYKVIEECELTEDKKQELLAQEGMNAYNLKKIKSYTWTEKAKEYFFIPNVQRFILKQIKSKVMVKIRNFWKNVQEKRRKEKELERLKIEHLNINFKGCCPNSSIYDILKENEICNAWDFKQFTLRQICHITLISKSTLEKIEFNINNELGGFKTANTI